MSQASGSNVVGLTDHTSRKKNIIVVAWWKPTDWIHVTKYYLGNEHQYITGPEKIEVETNQT